MMSYTKKTKRNMVIAFIVFIALFLVLSSVFRMTRKTKGVPNNILDYIGTEEEEVYEIYDKRDFFESGAGITNPYNNPVGLPQITIAYGEVDSFVIGPEMESSFNVKGLHVGDDLEKIDSWVKKMDAHIDQNSSEYYSSDAYGDVVYEFQYNEKEMYVYVEIRNGLVTYLWGGLDY